MICTYQMLHLLLVVLFYFSSFQAGFSELISAVKLDFVQSISKTENSILINSTYFFISRTSM